MTARGRQGSSSGKLRDITSSTASTSRERIGREMRIYTLKSCPDGVLPVARLYLPYLPHSEMSTGDHVLKHLSLLRVYSHLSHQRKVSIA